MSLRHLNIGQIRILFCPRTVIDRAKVIYQCRKFCQHSELLKNRGHKMSNQTFISTEGKICLSDYSVLSPPTHLLCMHTNGITKIANEIAQE
jgi:hypothetical protein